MKAKKERHVQEIVPEKKKKKKNEKEKEKRIRDINK